jgi:Carboxypeptidase regulatory-like domain/TonB-dependent Receptor Plug Domain
MNKNRGIAPVLWVLVAILLVSTAFAQETTAGLQGTVKDPQGLLVSKAVIELTSTSLIGSKKVETDATGYYRFANLPPGAYTIVVTAPGFRTLKQTGLVLEVGKLPSIDLKLDVGAIEQTVEVSSAAPLVDVTQSKVQTNVTSEEIEAMPKGRSFQSVIAFAPGARNEPLQRDRTGIGQNTFDGYQIDGATTSENSYLVEGQETSDVQSGQTKTNTPFEFIQEVQVKTSGFEAEYGGALGGVVNVIQKRGGNAWHGSVVTYYTGDAFNASPVPYVRQNPNQSDDETQCLHETAGVCDTLNPSYRTPAGYQMYQPKKDHRRTIEPGFEVGGYLLKDRLWAFTSFVPRLDSLTRTVNWNYTGSVGPRTFEYHDNTYYALSRVDFLATQKIRLYGAWQYAYNRTSGSSLPSADDVFGLSNPSATTNPDNYRTQIGYVQPNVIYNTGADITLTQNLIATTRFGRNYTDYQDRGLLGGIRYRWLDSNYISGQGYGTWSSIGATSITNAALPAAYQKAAGVSTIGVNLATMYDNFERRSLSQDLAWFKKGFGTHNIKGGYAFNRLQNNVLNGYNTAQAYVAYGRAYTVLAANQSVCASIRATNVNLYGAAGSADNTSCRGLWGTVNFREYGTTGGASSYNHALYFQDAWTVGKGLTINAGLRFDKETLPSFKEGTPSIGFGFGEKMAPRLGASWDVFQNGKMKVYGSFGYFFDIMKYEMPRGSFGGDYWHDCVYALDDPDYTKLVPIRTPGPHFCNPTGGANLSSGASGLRFIENKDFRIPSNDPSAYAIEPNLKPMKQHEMVIGADYALTPQYGIETRYSRKRLDRTIEDAGLLTSAGEQFYIVNPGEGIHKNPVDTLNCVGCPNQPKAIRNYDAIEFRFTRKASEKWFATFSYTYSRLWGNYSGLTATDVADTAGRASPNVDRAFDEPWMQFDAHGNVTNGLLATDRPNTFKAFGYYRLKWLKSQETLLGFTQQWYSGTPLTTYYDAYGANQYPEGRGMFVPATLSAKGPNGYTVVFGTPSFRRTPQFLQSDFSLNHEFRVSKTNEALRLGFEANVQNLFNQKSAVSYGQLIFSSGSVQPTAGLTPACAAATPADGCAGVDYKSLMTGFNWKGQANADGVVLNSQYGQPSLFQNGRNLRFKLKFTF